MNINSRLYDTIESNPNIKDKTWFNQNLKFAESIYKVYDVDYNYDNLLEIIKKIKIVETNEDEDIHYEKDTNTLVLGKMEENKEFKLCKSFLEITSQGFDKKNNSYTSGIIYKDEEGNELGKRINEILINELIVINTGLSIDNVEELISINPLDTVIKDILSITGSNNLITYFAFGQGEILFEQISSVIGHDNTKQFYKSVDNYEKNPTLNKILYDLCINALLNSKEINNTTPKM